MYQIRAILLLTILAGCYAPVVYAEADCLQNPGQALGSEEGKPRHWYHSDFPLTLVTDSTATAEQKKELQSAVDLWNSQAHFTVFTIGEKGKNLVPVYFTKIEVAPGKTIAGFGPSSVDDKGHITYALVMVDSELKGYVLANILTHELGHVLGLQHDPDNELSIMHPTGLGLVVWPDDLAYVRSEGNVCNGRP